MAPVGKLPPPEGLKPLASLPSSNKAGLVKLDTPDNIFKTYFGLTKVHDMLLEVSITRRLEQ